MVVMGRLDQKMPGPIFCPSPALDVVLHAWQITTVFLIYQFKNTCLVPDCV